jgi:hypothetical protein
MSILARITLTIMALGATCANAADCKDMSTAQPASLDLRESEQRLMQTLSPAWRGDEQLRLTSFGAYVNRNGEINDPCCWTSSIKLSSDDGERLRDKLRQLRLRPATLDGQPLEVFVGFTVVGMKTDAGIESRLLLNQLWSREKFGSTYTAPQRIGQSNQASVRVRGEIAVDVSNTGKALATSVHSWEQGSKKRRNYLLEMMNDECYIPGFVDGQPTAMTYVERFHVQ